MTVTTIGDAWAPRRPLWGSFNGLAYVPRLPPTAYTLLLHLLTEQEPGGLVAATHDELGNGLAMGRDQISRAMPYLVAARLVTVVRRGRFQLHPAIAAFNTPKEQQQAMRALPPEMRLDEGDFEEEYERRLAQHQEEKARKAEQRSNRVSDISQRPRLKAVR
ncbi:hypothetical protein ABT093_24425 [Kitasatospora sp. NPDC002551]|uniref:hypothetical protein n=1 Tax=Kitasatospora sp. NPDC002551 TaxID=3154539 RepID=UPI0033280BD1